VTRKKAAPVRGRPEPDNDAGHEVGAKDAIAIALPKGRVLSQIAPFLTAVGVDVSDVLADDRRLIRHDPRTGFRFFLLKPDDVPTWIEYGAADLGVVGRDVLLERSYDLYTPVDLGIGVCRMVVAGKKDARTPRGTLRVATKFPAIAARHYAASGTPVEIILVQGSVELAPLTGLSDVIVDLVESGRTLKENGLEVLEHVADVSSVVAVNRSALKLKRARLRPLLDALAKAALRS
jgi:ATP phosphoribosyltransferase